MSILFRFSGAIIVFITNISTASFLSVDPFQLNPSPFEFVANDPINGIDKTGRAPVHFADALKNLTTITEEEEELLGHTTFPNSCIEVDVSSLKGLKQSTPGNVFVGVHDLEINRLYLAPVAPRPKNVGNWQATSFEGEAFLNGEAISPIIHGDLVNGRSMTSHEQLARKAANFSGRVFNAEEFAGFGIIHRRDGSMAFGYRSRSLNKFKFKKWNVPLDFDGEPTRDAAFQAFYERKNQRLEIESRIRRNFDPIQPLLFHGPPNIEDLVEPDLSHGTLNKTFRKRIFNELKSRFPSRMSKFFFQGGF